MATRQSVTSKFFQPPGTTSSLTEDNRKPQVLQQRMEPTSNSLLEVPTDLLICILVLPTEPTRQRGGLKNTWKKLGALSLCNWPEERLSGEDELWEAEKILHLSSGLQTHLHLQWPGIQAPPSCLPPPPVDTHWLRQVPIFHAISTLPLNSESLPPTPPSPNSTYSFQSHLDAMSCCETSLIPLSDVTVSPLKSYRSLATSFIW